MCASRGGLLLFVALTLSDLAGVNCAEEVDGVDVRLDRDETVVLYIPSAGGGRLHTSAIILLDHARHYVLHWLAQFRQLFDAVLNDLLGPLGDLVAVVDGVSVENAGNHRADQLLNLGGVEFGIVLVICH